MNRSLYPDNWEQIAFAIKQEAQWTCEGCGRPCLHPGESVTDFVGRLTTELPIWLIDNPETHPRRFLLSVAHLDHLPQNCERTNLRAWCCPCHCRYDLAQMTRKKHLKAEREGQLSLDDIEADIESSVLNRLTGNQLSMLPDVQPYRIVSSLCSGGKPSPSSDAVNTSNRQHRPKGQASGWVEERQGNQKRKNPSISYYYRWDSPEGRVNEYIRASRLPKVNRLIAENRPALEILRVVTAGKRLSGASARLLNEASS
ncbi:MAG: hypothetical protein AAFO87_07670 [Cyanobacteria bacterium J06607_6]